MTSLIWYWEVGGRLWKTVKCVNKQFILSEGTPSCSSVLAWFKQVSFAPDKTDSEKLERLYLRNESMKKEPEMDKPLQTMAYCSNLKMTQ